MDNFEMCFNAVPVITYTKESDMKHTVWSFSNGLVVIFGNRVAMFRWQGATRTMTKAQKKYFLNTFLPLTQEVK
jgi:hypothetical protein